MAKLHAYAEAVIKYLKDQEVEIYCGTDKTILKFADYDVCQKNLIKGVLVDACGDCLIVECLKNGMKNTIFLNCWAVYSIVPVRQGALRTKDMHVDEEER